MPRKRLEKYSFFDAENSPFLTLTKCKGLGDEHRIPKAVKPEIISLGLSIAGLKKVKTGERSYKDKVG